MGLSDVRLGFQLSRLEELADYPGGCIQQAFGIMELALESEVAG